MVHFSLLCLQVRVDGHAHMLHVAPADMEDLADLASPSSSPGADAAGATSASGATGEIRQQQKQQVEAEWVRLRGQSNRELGTSLSLDVNRRGPKKLREDISNLRGKLSQVYHNSV